MILALPLTQLQHNCLQSKKKIKIKMLYTEVGCVGVVLVVVQESFLLEPY
jgi:hypothetical protein